MPLRLKLPFKRNNGATNMINDQANEQWPDTMEKSTAGVVTCTPDDREKHKHEAPSIGSREDNTAGSSVVEGDAVSHKTERRSDDGAKEDGTKHDDDSKYPRGLKLAILTFGLVVAMFIVALDNTIIATAIPRITDNFKALNDVGWYGSSYLLTSTALQPTFGKIYTHFDVKWIFLAALLIFEVGSVLCAAASGSKMFIIGRAVSGIGAAGIYSGAITIVTYSVPLRKRAVYIAMLGSMFGIASIVGPILGGVLTDQLSWRWCFWINLPIGAVGLFVVLCFFNNPPRTHTDMRIKDKFKQMDLIGAIFLICGIVCLLLALQWGGSVYHWSDSKVWGCLLGFGLLIFVFFGLQFYLGDRATMPPRILGQRTVCACAMLSAFLAMALYTHIYYLPFYFQAVKGTTAEGSGIRCIPYLVSMTLSSIVSGGLITAIGYFNPSTIFGVVVYTIGSALLYTLNLHSTTGTWIGYQILAGFGAGACVQVPYTAVQAVLPEKDIPIGNAVAIFFNSLGGAISISVAQNIFTSTLNHNLPPDVNVSKIISAGATHVRNVVRPKNLVAVLGAFNRAVTTAFILPIAVCGVALGAALLLEWKSMKQKR